MPVRQAQRVQPGKRPRGLGEGGAAVAVRTEVLAHHRFKRNAAVWGHEEIRPLGKDGRGRRTKVFQPVQGRTLAFKGRCAGTLLEPHAKRQLFLALDPDELALMLKPLDPPAGAGSALKKPGVWMAGIVHRVNLMPSPHHVKVL